MISLKLDSIESLHRVLSWGMIEPDIMRWTVELWPIDAFEGDCRRMISVIR